MVYRITKRGGEHHDQEADEGLRMMETRPEMASDGVEDDRYQMRTRDRTIPLRWLRASSEGR